MSISALSQWWLSSGALGALMVSVLFLESLVLGVLYKRGLQPIPVSMVLSMNAAGLTLVTALQLALWDAPAWAVLLSVSAALVCHLIDLYLRWRMAGKVVVGL